MLDEGFEPFSASRSPIRWKIFEALRQAPEGLTSKELIVKVYMREGGLFPPSDPNRCLHVTISHMREVLNKHCPNVRIVCKQKRYRLVVFEKRR